MSKYREIVDSHFAKAARIKIDLDDEFNFSELAGEFENNAFIHGSIASTALRDNTSQELLMMSTCDSFEALPIGSWQLWIRKNPDVKAKFLISNVDERSVFSNGKLNTSNNQTCVLRSLLELNPINIEIRCHSVHNLPSIMISDSVSLRIEQVPSSGKALVSAFDPVLAAQAKSKFEALWNHESVRPVYI